MTGAPIGRTTSVYMQQSVPVPPLAGYGSGIRGTPLLDTVQTPKDMKALTINELKQLSHELRWETINAVSILAATLDLRLALLS